MQLTVQCWNCDKRIAVSDEDRGASVYCPSCGRECDVPADLGEDAGPPSRPGWLPERDETAAVRARENDTTDEAAERRRASVFTSRGAAQVQEKTVGELACLCGATIPFTVEDYGSTKYCPSCGAGLPVGEQLQKLAVARVSSGEESKKEKVSVAVSKSRFRWVRSPAGFLTALAVAVALVIGVFITWRDPTLLPAGVRAVLPVASVAPSASRPADTGEETDDEPEPEEEITLEAIKKLREQKDLRMALNQARYWDRELKSKGIPLNPDKPEPKRAVAVSGIAFGSVND